MKTAPEKKRSPSHPEAKGLAFLTFSLILLISQITFTSADPGSNWLGLLGHGLAFTAHTLFGLPSYLVTLYLAWRGWELLASQEKTPPAFNTLYFFLFVVSLCMLLNLCAELGTPLPTFIKARIYTESILVSSPYPHEAIRYNLGGVPLYFLYRDLPGCNLQKLLSNVGIAITFSTIGLVSFFLWSQKRIFPLLLALKRRLLILYQLSKKTSAPEPLTAMEAADIEKSLSSPYPQPIYNPGFEIEEKEVPRKPIPRKEKEPPRLVEAKQPLPIEEKKAPKRTGGSYQLPPASLLNPPKKSDQPSLKKELRRQAEILEETLMSFGIEAKVGEINCGPTITSFEVQPSVGVKVQKITALENDIALNLQAKSIRIIAPIPGKAAVGVEVPSLYPQEVSFKEMLVQYMDSPRKFHIPFLLGKTVSGDNLMSDLAKMPHCIIAGATGSGKSVCINTIIMSILMTARPDEIKLMMIDPKKVELTPYTSLPHMIAPVITEPHGALSALNWLVKEMQTRYDMLKQLGLRNITAFNNRKIDVEFEASLGIPVPPFMHAIVAIVDEFADLMMVSSSDLETPIARIAQMARAVGIHLILATQRPSREVITGLIKANFPTRIAFKVASRINSQIILDETGAESLLGNGDMLFLPPGSSILVRAQGAYISDEEIQRVVSFICDQAPPGYLIPSFDHMLPQEMAEGGSDEGSPRDNLYDQALMIVLETKNASTTFLQRKLKIGYARAASLMDELQAKGVITPQEGSRPRRVLLNSPLDFDPEKE
jgi:DNA segregation ATPase FtsK/SpoIIIE, S-DNA-T family